jgi:hypothetical protein
MSYDGHRERMLAELERRIAAYTRRRRWTRRLRRAGYWLTGIGVLAVSVVWLWWSRR